MSKKSRKKKRAAKLAAQAKAKSTPVPANAPQATVTAPAKQDSKDVASKAAMVPPSKEAHRTYYIAYGSNLNIRQMRGRCPKAKPIGKFTLTDARLVFRGVADVIYDQDSTVPCGLWSITAKCERELDRYEGYRPEGGGLYRKEYITLSIGGKAEKALIYVMNRDYIDAPGDHYLATIEQGYEDFGMCTDPLYDAVVWSQRHASPRAIPKPQPKPQSRPAQAPQSNRQFAAPAKAKAPESPRVWDGKAIHDWLYNNERRSAGEDFAQGWPDYGFR